MKKTIYLMTFLFSFLMFSTNLLAQNTCPWNGQGSHQGCKGFWTTVYIDKNATGPVTFSVSAPSEGVVAVAGPNTDASFIKQNSSIIITLATKPIDTTSWMELIVPGGYYHIKLVLQ